MAPFPKPRTSGVPKYYFRSVSPEEFKNLRLDAGVSIRDFMFLTGRHSNVVSMFHGEGTREGTSAQKPTISDILILELIKEHPELHDTMIGIANRYSEGPQIKKGKE